LPHTARRRYEWSSMSNPIPFLRKVALAEGVSYLLLLGIAMPLKYLAGMPLAVLIVGSVHGGLFILFCIALARAHFAARWPLGRSAQLFIAAVPADRRGR
jgi:integral membrane protein